VKEIDIAPPHLLASKPAQAVIIAVIDNNKIATRPIQSEEEASSCSSVRSTEAFWPSDMNRILAVPCNPRNFHAAIRSIEERSWNTGLMEILRTILNILWLLIAGLWSAIAYAIAGLIMFLLFFLIITIPFGIASFRLAGYALWPFGRTVIRDPEAGAPSVIGNIIWFILAGLWLAIGQFIAGVVLCITIIGIPFGIANFKLARLSINPLGKQVVPLEYADAAQSGWQGYVPVK
jgi:uncharacterized membrane protein YccF (DUF307 family)